MTSAQPPEFTSSAEVRSGMKYDDVDDLIYGVVRMDAIPYAWYYYLRCHSMQKKGGINYFPFINFIFRATVELAGLSYCVRLDYIVSTFLFMFLYFSLSSAICSLYISFGLTRRFLRCSGARFVMRTRIGDGYVYCHLPLYKYNISFVLPLCVGWLEKIYI